MPKNGSRSASARHVEWRDAGSDVVSAVVCIAAEVSSGQTLPTATMAVIARRHGHETAVACYLAAKYAVERVGMRADAVYERLTADHVQLLKELP